MNIRYLYQWRLAAAVLVLSLNFGLGKAFSAPPAPVAGEEGIQVQTRGQVHEAFAETVTFNPQPGIVAPKAPPAAIEELPPDQKPEGANVAWIPGYWGWDDERNDFLWVSGIWRALPPGRQWVAGYWGPSARGSQWTSGYWADAKASEVEYLPEPPATVEAGPNIAAPSPDNTWLPGCWVWQNRRYAWRPGYWAAVQPDWDWVPAHYVWAPRGYVFVDGYWDYSIARRGVLFAPVYFSAGVYSRPGFSYSPTFMINPAVFGAHLFLRPQYQHYYFGDYYAANYQTAGYYPSYSYNSGRYGYDPIYAHERWQHRQDGQWEHRVAADFLNRRAHEDARPVRTWAAQALLGAGAAVAGERRTVMAGPFSQFTQSPNSPLRFQPVDQSERQKLGQYGQAVQQFRQQRQKLEIGVAGPSADGPPKQFAPTRGPLPRSPIVAQPVGEIGKNYAPPKTYAAPQPDPRIEPKLRVTQNPQQAQQRTVNRLPLDPAQPQPQPRVERQTPQPQPQPRVERQAPQPQPQPRVERQAPQPQHRAEQAVPQSRGNAAGANQEKPKEKGKDK